MQHTTETATNFPVAIKGRKRGEPFFQPKLMVNQPGDEYEQEADAVADKVMRMTGTNLPGSLLHFNNPAIQRKCQHCEEEEKLQRKEQQGETPGFDAAGQQYINSLNNKGRTLTHDESNFFEPRFGYDFSGVRLHTDGEAAASAKSINALAYTCGSNIVFDTGNYQPGTEQGKRLMAHELTHVVQQNNTIQRMVQRVPAAVDPTKASVCTMHFKQGTTEFTDAKEFAHCMQVIKDYLKANSDGQVILHGFASEEGDAGFNMDLSHRRAETVLKLLKAGKTDTSRITIQPHGEDKTFPKLEDNRRVEVVNFAEYNFPPEHIEVTPTCPVACKTPVTLFSNTTHCGSGADFLNSDLPGGPAAVTNQVKAGPYRLMSDATLLVNMETGLDGLGTLAGTEGINAANHFFGGSGTALDHDISTPIGAAADKSATFNATVSSVEAAFHKLITRMAGTPSANNCSTLKLTSGDVPGVNFPFPKSVSGAGDTMMLKAIIGGTHGIEVTLTKFTVDCTANTYEATIHYRVCDNFGVDETDMYSDSLISFWVLQHMRTGHAAYINNILLDRTFTKSF